MFILRTGKDLKNCSKGYFYKVVGSDSKTIVFLDNNGKESIARKNSSKWDFNPSCEINQAKIGSKNPELKPNSIDKSLDKNDRVKNKTCCNNRSSSDDFTTGFIVGSLLF